MTTTQDTRALIARLQARLGGGTPAPVTADPDSTRKIKEVELVPLYTLAFNDVGPGDSEALVGYVQSYDAPLICAAMSELPVQIARWLARLDEADRLRVESKRYATSCPASADGLEERATVLLATVTEDVQAWAVRLGVGE